MARHSSVRTDRVVTWSHILTLSLDRMKLTSGLVTLKGAAKMRPPSVHSVRMTLPAYSLFPGKLGNLNATITWRSTWGPFSGIIGNHPGPGLIFLDPRAFPVLPIYPNIISKT